MFCSNPCDLDPAIGEARAMRAEIAAAAAYAAAERELIATGVEFDPWGDDAEELLAEINAKAEAIAREEGYFA
jgi:hypothetical protein